MSSAIEPITPRAKKVRRVQPLDARTRRETAEALTPELAVIARKLRGMTGRMLVKHQRTGAFVAGYAGGSRVVLLPMPLDHTPDLEKRPEKLIDYMVDVARSALLVLDGDGQQRFAGFVLQGRGGVRNR